ncbi:MAG: FAD-dependent oxidoreductase, partial [Acidimicrobiia bacterium]|nr:FAD-dependent oxidoreductase [Acidimicrobiia bacterium]
MFDIAVIGLGLVGSAALRHLALSDASVVGIGPGEPTDWSVNSGPFASHYDSGRVTRRLDARYEWAELASRSIAQYPEIEAQSGLRFHRPVGFLFVRKDPIGIAQQQHVSERLDLPVVTTTTDAVRDEFQDYELPLQWTALYEPSPAGHIDPRLMVEAQLKV